MKNGRCRMHGGLSPGAPKGNKNALKHGRYTADAIARPQSDWRAAPHIAAGDWIVPRFSRPRAPDETDQAVRLVRQHRVDALMTLRKI
jgi:hypothetical protein